MSSFTYPVITKDNTYTNVLLIDSSVRDYQKFVDSVNSSTFPIVYSYTSSKTELLELFRENLTTISRIGICFTSPNIQFLDNKPFYINDETAPYSENFEFILTLIKEFQVKNIDYLACNTLQSSEWTNYYNILSTETGVIVGASNDRTGNIKYGGDWVMETTSEDIELVYFTQSIEYYTYLLDSGFSTLIIKNDGTLWGIGYNGNGNLGLNNTTSYYNVVSSFQEVTLLDGKTPKHIITIGTSASVILMTDGTLYASGGFYYNNNNSVEYKSIFTKVTIPSGKTIKYIYSYDNNGGSNTTFFIITSDNKIYYIGDWSELNYGLIYRVFTELTNTTGKIPVYIDGNFQRPGNYWLNNTIVLMSDGTVYCIGINDNGLFGLGNNNRNACSVLTPMIFHNDMISSGAVAKSMFVGHNYTAILATNGKIYYCGDTSLNGYIPSTSLVEITNTTGKIPKLISGYFYIGVLMTDNTIYGIGYTNRFEITPGNNYLTSLTELTQYTTNGRPIKSIHVTAVYLGVLFTNGDFYMTGSANAVGLVNSNIIITYSSLTYLTNNVSTLLFDPQLTPGIYPSTSAYSLVTIKKDGKLFGTGNNFYGNLGLGNNNNYNVLTEITLPSGKVPNYVLTTRYYTIVLMTDGSLYSSGTFIYSPTSTATNVLTQITTPVGKTIKNIYSGPSSTLYSMIFALMTDNTLYQLGYQRYSSTVIINSPQFELVSLPSGKIPLQIKSGDRHTMFLMTDGTLYGRGINTNGQISTPTHELYLSSSGTGTTSGSGSGSGGTVYSTSAIAYNNTIIQITYPTQFIIDKAMYGTTIQSISVGPDTTVIIASNGKIYANNGVIGGPTINSTTTSYKLFAEQMALFTNNTGKTPKEFFITKSNSYILMTDGSFYSTGLGNYGQLGLGNFNDTSTLQLVTLPTGKTIQSINVLSNEYSDSSVAILFTDGTIFVDGRNDSGQIGLGSTVNTASLTNIDNTVTTFSRMAFDVGVTTHVHCFLEGSKILTINGYVPIEQLKQGDLIKTTNSTYIPIYKLGKRVMHHHVSNERDKNILYKCSQKNYPELTEDLIITGCHSILVVEFKNNQREKTIELLKKIYITDDEYRLPACVDDRTTIYETEGDYTVYHIALENDNDYFNYGIYANGLLVESCSKIFLNKVYDMNVY